MSRERGCLCRSEECERCLRWSLAWRHASFSPCFSSIRQRTLRDRACNSRRFFGGVLTLSSRRSCTRPQFHKTRDTSILSSAINRFVQNNRDPMNSEALNFVLRKALVPLRKIKQRIHVPKRLTPYSV